MSEVQANSIDDATHPHTIDPARLSGAAVEVTRMLNEAGYSALLVGGCVRDLLLGHSPKDYDVATDATPEQVRAVFRRSRIVGRRFRIVHVRFGREVIEVTTFRKSPDQGHRTTREGRILEDNEWGDLDSDVLRRDFTVNALYYDPLNDEGVDLVDGLTDLEDRLLRIIGDPDKRFQEDPVRVLRAVRFMAKLDFNIESDTERAMLKAIPQLSNVPAARLFDEVLKLFHHGHGLETCRLLEHYGIFKRLFPAIKTVAGNSGLPKIIECALANTDQRVRSDKPVIAAFLFAAFLWPPTQKKLTEAVENGRPYLESLYQAFDSVMADTCEVITIPRRVSAVIREIWELEFRLRERRPKHIEGLLENRRFRAAYDFLLLRCEAGEDFERQADWWRTIQSVPDHERRAMIQALGPVGKRRRPRKRPARKDRH